MHGLITIKSSKNQASDSFGFRVVHLNLTNLNFKRQGLKYLEKSIRNYISFLTHNVPNPSYGYDSAIRSHLVGFTHPCSAWLQPTYKQRFELQYFFFLQISLFLLPLPLFPLWPQVTPEGALNYFNCCTSILLSSLNLTAKFLNMPEPNNPVMVPLTIVLITTTNT